MLNSKLILKKLMDYLRSIDERLFIPKSLDDKLEEDMEHEPVKAIEQVFVRHGKVPDRAFYIVSGFVMVYYFDEKGKQQLFRIYQENSIVAMDCFMNQTASPYFIVACKSAVLISITHEHMKEIYATIGVVHELATKTASSYEKKELLRDSLLDLPIEERIEKFYAEFKGLLPPGKVIRDLLVASYLRISKKTLSIIRKKLMLEGRI
jgi:CRP-like cAMP-binding protein